MLPLITGEKAVRKTVWCTTHQQFCELKSADLHCAGFPCVSWSPQGKRLKDGGDDFVHWCAWVAERRISKETESRMFIVQKKLRRFRMFEICTSDVYDVYYKYKFVNE